MKRKNLWAGVLLCFPWVFAMLHLDFAYGWGIQYLVCLLCMMLLALCCRDAKVVVRGNAVGLCLSVAAIWLLHPGESNWYFKPFGALGWALVLTGLSWLLQWLVYKKQWLLLALLTGALGSMLLALYGLQFSM